MDQSNHFFKQTWRFIDHSTLGLTFSALDSFAYDDSICTSIGNNESPATIRTWVHASTVVLGTQDSRLPTIADGIHYLTSNQYSSIVRNSGGLAVVLDEEVLNLSLIIKEEKGLSINMGYDLMLELIQKMFPESSIIAGEVVGSYCPGSYDLSIDGKKFAGISQRRIRNGVAVQIYLCVRGSGSKRAELIREFYERAVQGKEANFDYPHVVPETMASLAELTGKDLSIQDVTLRCLKAMQQLNAKLEMGSLTELEKELFIKNVARVYARNEKCLS
ncbi:biotin/lipoate A/B protein ligase family protein [Alkalihalobacillus sp. 1P02AB]|uniref:lipoate--protein ligase family protein n=1 Tax=Alkalihalobacillus sp. 1P02AB TaxID=3132260 RepID=UPI0039A4265D